jgi:hypothetical protein
MNRDGRRYLAKCISGFANSSGGIVVWGVDARRNDQGIDCASASAEITPVRLLLTRLNEHTGQATSPMVDGVQHKVLETGPDAGYAATFVSESTSGPHMAKLGEDRYFKRSGDRFYRMEHFDLEDMFGRRQKPDLHLSAVLMEGLGDERERVAFSFRNTGRALAKHAGFLAFFENAVIANVSGGVMEDVTKLNNGRAAAEFRDNKGVIHPIAIGKNVGWVAFKRLEKNKPVVVHGTWYCENMVSREETFLLPPAPLVALPGLE